MNSCTKDTAQQLIDKSMDFHKSNLLENSKLSFVFRDKKYSAARTKGTFEYKRIFTDSTGAVEDTYNNSGFERTVNGSLVELTEEQKRKFSNSVNSVIYFAVLPYGLNDASVLKRYIGLDTIANKHYECIEISFKEEGGGEDFNDVFYYWLDANDLSLDYFAYIYQTDGGGIRFRKAVNSRVISGVTVQDYINYKPTDSLESTTKLEDILALYKTNQLEELSKIELIDVIIESK